MNDYDVFISYASEDRDTIAKPLAQHLASLGLKVWFDDDCMDPKRSPRQEIDLGLRRSSAGVAILSPDYFAKEWTRRELDALLAKEASQGCPIIAVLHRLTEREATVLSPIMAGKPYVPDGIGPAAIAATIQKKLAPPAPVPSTPKTNTKPHEATPMETYAPGTESYAIGIDVGTAYIDRGVVRFPADYTQLPEIIESLPRIIWSGQKEAHQLVDRICRAIDDTARNSYVQPRNISQIGIGLPGQVDPVKGYLLNAPALQLSNLDIANDIRERLIDTYRWPDTVKILIDNDVTCMAMAEKVLGLGSGGRISNFVCVAIGRGIGSGIVVDGNTYKGANYNAGEVGHMVIDISDDARDCPCGSKGCFESYCAERGILQTALKHIALAKTQSPNSPLAQLGDTVATLSPEQVSDIVGNSDDTDGPTKKLREELAKHFAVGLANIANILNPQVIIITGGVGLGFYQYPSFQNAVNNFLKKYILQSNAVNIVRSRIKGKAQIIGAAMLGLTQATR